MSRENVLSVKEKWALDAQLGELLRGLDTRNDVDEQFKKRLDALMAQYDIDHQTMMDVLVWLDR
ncbi:hypothetical protein [Larsenimonas rhizosphaerae]|uniref:Uncharacterized protein n=1 Tax=Larsenimonas rhizosphaerae TaxID=2944682 RepID=A0AA42CU08_9GAMM|nr:hypothetical protein [Larsenimonas rhizosphaerae]MCM2131129.1 hypothetical protein [Larsenimonas rhizosphaerae]MCX2523834.1 hypothetical protein [Larsenimonas rhizosphaerae]